MINKLTLLFFLRLAHVSATSVADLPDGKRDVGLLRGGGGGVRNQARRVESHLLESTSCDGEIYPPPEECMDHPPVHRRGLAITADDCDTYPPPEECMDHQFVFTDNMPLSQNFVPSPHS
jgi:hypothetical protein